MGNSLWHLEQKQSEVLKMQQYNDVPQVVRDFLMHAQVVRGSSKVTCEDYYFDLRSFFKYLKMQKAGMADESFEQIDITDITIDFVRSITLSDIYNFIFYMQTVRGNTQSSNRRRISCIRSFFKYLTNKAHLLEYNPAEELESPKVKKQLPKYLVLEDSIKLLESVEGPNKQRDFAILTLFLNCGLRLSELVNLNLSDIRGDFITVNGKGNKQRNLYLNDACKTAIENYLPVRPTDVLKDRDALFISRNRQRISPKTVQWLVKKYLSAAGLSDQQLSTHKLRHTAATLMHRHGNVDVRLLQKFLGHENLGTTQIYTHIEDEQVRQAAEANPLSNFKNKK